MGRILAPYGIRGWLKVQPQTEAVDGLLDYREWWLAPDSDWKSYRLLEGQAHGTELIAHLQGFDDRDQAAAIRGFRIAVPRSVLPPAPEGEYYWADLVGMSVLNAQGEELGRIEEIFATGANDVLVVRGDRERLIPFIDAVVMKVDMQTSRLLVDWAADY
jgi:16S rRNA processing protein RimM